MGFVLLGILNSQAAGEGAITYRLQTLGSVNFDLVGSVKLDSSNNIYVGGTSQFVAPGNSSAVLVKYDNSGSILFQSAILSTSSLSINTDSAGNIYQLGTTSSEGEGSTDFVIAKYNSSGSLQWQRVLGTAESEQTINASQVGVDSSDNIYIFGQDFNGTTGDRTLLLAKYDSAGSIQWQRQINGTGSESAFSTVVDSFDNVYIVGRTDSEGEGSNDVLLIKYNSAGTIQWQRILGGAGFDEGNGLAIDSADNVYISGNTDSEGQGSRDILLAKYNSSGTIQWQRILGGAGFDQAFSTVVDSEDNVYLAGKTASEGEGLDDFILAKYNSSGTIQWQRILGGTGDEEAYSITLDSSNNIYVVGKTDSTGEGSSDWLIAVLPNDGSLTGTYVLDEVNMIYSASTLTSATSTLVAATSSLPSSTPSLVSSVSTLSTSTPTLIEHRVNLE